jgi:hypothetical protein
MTNRSFLEQAVTLNWDYAGIVTWEESIHSIKAEPVPTRKYREII